MSSNSKALLPSRVLRGNSIHAASLLHPSNRKKGGPPGAVWLCTGADCPAHARSSIADLPMGPPVSLVRTAKALPLAHLHSTSVADDPGDGQQSAYSLHQSARGAQPRATCVSHAPVLH